MISNYIIFIIKSFQTLQKIFLMKLPIFILTLCCSFLITPKNCNATAPADSSISKYNKYKTHILTLDYISRKTNNSKYFLNMAGKYCDSLMIIGKDSAWAQAFKEKIELTLITCEYNMNHKIQLFPYFNGMPPFMGFADDVIEYAYDNALEELFNTTFKKIHNGPLSKANISSIIVRGECDDEMFEIVRQTILSNTSHYIVTSEKLNQLLGTQKTKDLTNGIRDNESMNIICKSLELENLGVFYVTNMDNIDEKIWLVHTEFSTYSPDNGIAEAVFSRGFSQDKRDVLGINILLLILESILFIALIAVFDEIIIKFIRTRKLFSAKEIFFQFVKKLKFVSICFATPTLLSFVMIYSLSFLSPDPADHFKEYNSILWIIVLTLGMSIIPLFLNLFLINRLQLDGFHNIRGYRTFANASLYATYLPIFVFYIIQFEREPIISLFLLVVLTFVIGDLLARSYFQFTSKSKHRNLKTQAVSGLIIGILALIFFNTYALTEISPTVFISSLVFIAPLSLIHWGMGKYMDRINEKKLESSTERTLLSDLKFIKDVIDPSKDIYERINNSISKENLNLMIVAAPMGIGKTRSLEEAKEIFTKNKWNWYYGDCDEIQDENTISFEPFIEAFKDLLKVQEFTDRSQHMENISGDAIKAMADITGAGSDMISELKRDENRSMTEICVEIAEKLEASKNKTVFVMEDLHWIDPESYAFLKHFIKTINRNEFIRGNLCIILTLRNDQVSNYRGVDYKKLMGDLKDLDEQLESKTIIEDLLTEQQFNVKDFINHISKQNKQFKIQDDSLADINYKLNSALSDNKDKLTITPLYILKVIEQWIQNKVLKYTPDGYVLTSSIDSMELPNTDEIDSYYHSILNEFDKKWTRILESAAIIGNKFNANILSQVWGYELLEILGFLESAEEKGLITDVSDEDNIYKFNDKRIISAIKSYFPGSQDTGVKQIIIEYNKRYLELQKSIIEDPSEYSIEEVLSVVRRLALMMSNPQYNESAKRLIFEIIVRLIADEEYDKIDAFTDFLKNRKLTALAELIFLINKIASPDTSYLEVTHFGKELISTSYAEGSIEQELRIYGLMLHKMISASAMKKTNEIIDINDEKNTNKPKNNQKQLIENSAYADVSLGLTKNELKFILNRIEDTYKGTTLLSLGFLYLNSSSLKMEEKLNFLDKLDKKLTASKEHHRFNLYIEDRKLTILLKNNFEGHDIDNLSADCLKKALTTADLRLIKLWIKLRIKVVSQYLNKREQGIEIYMKNINLLLTNGVENIHWVSCVIDFYYTWSGGIYCKEYPEEAEKDLKRCEEFIYKRHNTNDWSNLIDKWFNAKEVVLNETGKLDDLKAVCEKHLQIIASSIGDTSLEYAKTCYEYAEYFKLTKEYDKMIKYRLIQIEIVESHIKTNPSLCWDLETSYLNMASYYMNYFEDYDNALKFALKSLKIVENYKGIPDHSIAASHYWLARVYKFGKKYDEAIKHYNKSIDYKIKAYGKNSYEIAKSYADMSNVFDSKNDVPRAIESLEKALNILLINSTKENDVTSMKLNNSLAASVYNSLGRRYLKTNKNQDLRFFKSALAFNIKTHGKLDTTSDLGKVKSRILSYQNLGECYHFSGDYLNALKNLKKSLSISESNDLDNSNICIKIANVLINEKNYKIAIDYLIKGFESDSKAGGFPYKLGFCYEQLKEYEKAIENYVLCAKLRKDAVGIEHKATQDAIKQAIRLAKKSKNEQLVPEWIFSSLENN